MQEDLLQPHLSVEELMMIAARLKLGDHISLEGKTVTVGICLVLMVLIQSLFTTDDFDTCATRFVQMVICTIKRGR